MSFHSVLSPLNVPQQSPKLYSGVLWIPKVPHGVPMAPHSSSLAWKIPWMEKPCWLQSMGPWTVGHDWATSLSLFTFMHCRGKWQPTPVFLPGEPQGWGEPGELPSMGSHRVRHGWSDLAVAAAAKFHRYLLVGSCCSWSFSSIF